MIGHSLFRSQLVIAATILLSLSLCSEARYPGGPGYDDMSNCAEFKCKNDDETPVPKSPLDYLSSSGCNGIGGGGFSMMGGDRDMEVNKVLGPCCDMFHACLQMCGTKKQFCVRNASNCMESNCQSVVNPKIKKQCLSEFETKKVMFNFSGCTDFDLAQKMNCECVKMDSADEKRASVVQSFYTKYNPKNVEKASALAAKATDKNKLAGLLYKLVAKYPKAIRVSKNDKQQQMEDLLKNMGMDSRGNDAPRRPPKPQKVNDVEDNDDDERIEL